MKPAHDPDQTVIMRSPRPQAAPTPPMPPGLATRRLVLAGAAGAGLLAVAGGLFAALRPHPHPITVPPAEEQAILASDSPSLRAWRFAPAPSILVLLFPSLHAQALAMNRAAVFLELAGAPRDKVPDDAAMQSLIAASHQSFDSFYYGHDYRAPDLRRLWRLADAQGITLGPEEREVRALVEGAALAPEGVGAVITLPPLGIGLQDHAGRSAILRHELSHGLYFTDPDYAAMVDVFWRTRMSTAQKDAFRRFLGGQSYDTTNEELMRNETQAYLVNTPDARFFSAAAVGLDPAEVAVLRQDFIGRMPLSWLKARTR